MKNKNTLLYDFMEIYKKIECDGIYVPCCECSNKKLCHSVYDIVRNIKNLYKN